MNEQEVRERLERYKKWRRDRSQKPYTGPPVANYDVDWLTDELERQLERNCRLDKQITEIVEAGDLLSCRIKQADEYSNTRGIDLVRISKYVADIVRAARRLVQALRKVKDE